MSNDYIARQKILKIARDMIDGGLAFLEGAHWIYKMFPYAALPESDPDIVVFTLIVSETETLPIGEQRQYWSSEALIKLQPEIDRSEKWARRVGLETCKNLIDRFTLKLRPYIPTDENASIELWHQTWTLHYPYIDFDVRLGWWRERWRNELAPVAHIILAEEDGKLVGFVTVDPKTLYLDQIIVTPERWGSGIAHTLLDKAKNLSPSGLELIVNKDNYRAIRFYEKNDFVYDGEDKNPVSGNPVYRMKWWT